MCRRTPLVSFVPSSFSALVLAALTTAGVCLPAHGRQDPPAAAAPAPAPAAPQYKKLEAKLKTEKEIAEKKKEKDRAKTGKSEKSDFAPIEEFYRDYYIPRLTESSADAINEARKEILDDIAAVESNKDIQAQYNEKLIRQFWRAKTGKGRPFRRRRELSLRLF